MAIITATRELVMVVVQALPGRGNTDLLQQVDSHFKGFVAGHSPVYCQHFGDLLADAQYRVKGGHRFLEDHADAVAANSSHLRFGEIAQVVSGKVDRSLDDPPGGGDQAQNRQGSHRFTAARFADQGERLPLVDSQIDPGDGFNRASLTEEIGFKVGNV